MFQKRNTANHKSEVTDGTSTSRNVFTRPQVILAGAAVLSMLMVPVFMPGQVAGANSQVAAATPIIARADTSDIVPTQTWGTSSWRIDSTDTLHIGAGTTGTTEVHSLFVTTYKAPWSDYIKSIRGVVFDDPANTHLNPISQSLFHKLYADVEGDHLDTIVGISDVDTSQVTNMIDMFSESRISQLDLSKWDTSKVENMSNMFSRNTFTQLNVSNWNLASTTNTSLMFAQTKVDLLDLSRWNVSNVKNMSLMFDKSTIATLNVAPWHFGDSVNASFMFSNSSISNFDMSRWDLSQASNANFSFMFSNSSFTSLNVSSWDTLTAGNMNLGFMFPNGLTQIVLGQRSSFPDTAFVNVAPSTEQYSGHWALGTSATGEQWRSLASTYVLSNVELADRSRNAKAGTYVAELKGQETVQTVAIHFDKNAADATGAVDDIMVPLFGATGAEFPAGFSRPGYEFLGWNSGANGIGVPYKAGAKIPNSLVRTWYAQWKPKPAESVNIAVHFDKNAADATGSVADVAVPSVGYYKVKFPKADTLSRPGYNFIGWNSRADGSGQAFVPGMHIPNASVTTWYAQWRAQRTITVCRPIVKTSWRAPFITITQKCTTIKLW